MKKSQRQKSERVKSITIIFDIVISLIFNKEKAAKLKDLTRLKVKSLISVLITILLLFTGWFLFDTFKEPIQNKLRKWSINSNKLSFKSESENSLKVLILPFSEYNEGLSKFKIEKAIRDGLLEEKDLNHLKLEILFDSISSAPITSTDAQRKGELLTADIVISGALDSNNKEYRINMILIHDFNELDIPILLPKKHSSGYRKNLELSQILSLDSLSDEKFIIYNILGLSELKNGNCSNGIDLINKALITSSTSKNFSIENEEMSYYNLLCGACFFKNNDISNALYLIDNAIQVYPQNYEARIMKAVLLYSKHEYKEAKDEFAILKSMDIEEKSTVYLISAFLNFTSQADFELLTNDLKSSISIDRKDSSPSISGVFLDLLEGNFNRSIDIKTICEYNELPSIFEEISMFYLYTFDGNLEMALKQINKIEASLFILKKTRNDDLSQLIEGISLSKRVFEDINKIDIDSIYNHLISSTSQEATENVTNALTLSILIKKKGDLNKIKKLLVRALNQNPDYKYYFNFNGLSKSEVIKQKDIIAKNKKLLKGDSSDYLICIEISKAYKALGLNFVSVYYQNKAIFYNSLAIFYLPNDELNKTELVKLKTAYLKADSLSKISSDNKYSHYTKGQILKKMNYYSLAQKEYEEYHLANPNHYYCVVSLSYVTYYQENYEQSIKYCNKMIELRPNYYLGYYNRYCVYFELKDYQNAKKDIEQAIKIFDIKKDTIDYPNHNNLLKYEKALNEIIKNNT